MNEAEAAILVEQQLKEFGYPVDSLRFEYTTPLGRRADVVIFEGDKPKIVVEIKSTYVNLPDRESELKFHPATRQAQAYAKELNAPFFVITNGLTYRWFTTDVDGRPKLLQQPVYLESISREDKFMGKIKISQMLFGLVDQGRDQLSIESILGNIGAALLFYLEKEKGLQASKQSDHLDGITLHELFDKAYSTFTRFELATYSGSLLIQAIDEFLEFFLTDIKFAQFKLPLWLTNFMIGLARVETSRGFLDIYSNFGDGIVAAHQITQKIPVYSFSFSSFSFLWDRVKRAALGLANEDSLFIGTNSIDLVSLESPVDRVLVAPPFGGHIKLDNQQTQRSEIFYLEKALDLIDDTGIIVTIVPESFLFSQSQKKFRENLLEQFRLWTIISLEQFLPSTGIKANILVLEKQSTRVFGNVFMADLRAFDIKQISSGDKINKLNSLVQFLTKYQFEQDQTDSDLGELVSERELFDNSSWVVRSYLAKESENSAYPVKNLSGLCEVTRGADITLDEDGNIPVIGPSAVRAFLIDPTKFDKTSRKKISRAKTTPKYIKQNDILLHAIGPHRGEAALVTSEFDGLIISRHMLIISPKSQEVIPYYLVIALSSSFVRKQIYNISTGSVIASLTLGNVREILIPLPPIDEQKRIIERVNAIQSRLTQIENNLRETEGELETLLDNYYTLGVNND